jgi:hypothetical protein
MRNVALRTEKFGIPHFTASSMPCNTIDKRKRIELIEDMEIGGVSIWELGQVLQFRFSLTSGARLFLRAVVVTCGSTIPNEPRLGRGTQVWKRGDWICGSDQTLCSIASNSIEDCRAAFVQGKWMRVAHISLADRFSTPPARKMQINLSRQTLHYYICARAHTQ